MGLTLRQAADMCGKSRSTIHRALKSGKLSGSRDENGTWSIDPAELVRVFPWDVTGHAQRDADAQSRDAQGSEKESASVLAVKVEMLEDQLARERDTVDDLRKRLDKAEERIYLLSAIPSEPSPPRSAAKGGLWDRVKAVFSGNEEGA